MNEEPKFNEKNWRKERAKGVILTYLQGTRKVSLNWALRCLKSNFGVSKEEVIEIIEEIKKNPSRYLLDEFPARKEKLRELEVSI
jgi:hypothetical protein